MSGELGGLLTKKATFLFGLEAALGVNPGLTEDDAVEVGNPDYTTNPTILQRDYAANDLSPFADIIGKIIAGFKIEAEVKSNGRAQSGNLADTPILAKMISACGYDIFPMVATGSTAAPNTQGTHAPVVVDPSNGIANPKVAWASTIDATSVLQPVLYTIEVMTPGAAGSGQSTFIVTSNSKDDYDEINGDVIDAPVETAPIASGVGKVLLGVKGGSVIPTWAGDLVAGDKWSVTVFPKGIQLRPTSTDFPTASMKMNRDGISLEGNAGLGTFTIDATAGEIAKATFNFTTTFVEPDDEMELDVDFENDLLPSQVELSTLTWGGNRNLMIEKWSFDQANDIQARPSVNHKQGYAGSRISARAPSIGFNPEATHEADHPFWDEFTQAKQKTFVTRVGTEPGNMVCFWAGKAQTSDQKFTDRNGTMTYDKTAKAKRVAKGNDETIFVFC